MSRPPTPEEAFNLGAQAMQGKIAAVLAATGHMNIAPMVLGMAPPPFQLPEIMTLDRQPPAEL